MREFLLKQSDGEENPTQATASVPYVVNEAIATTELGSFMVQLKLPILKSNGEGSSVLLKIMRANFM